MIDKEALFKSSLPERVVTIPGVGDVRVRGLTRGEVFDAQQGKGTEGKERKILHIGLVEPALTEGEVGRWMRAAPAGVFEPIVDAIRELSAIDDGAAKRAMLNFRDGSDVGDGVSDSGASVDDGDPSTAGDA